MNNEDIVITSAFRTPIGSFLGSLSEIKAAELGSIVIKKCLNHSKLNNDDVDMCFLGQVLQAGCGQNPARQAAIGAGIEKEKLLLPLTKFAVLDFLQFHWDTIL